MCNDHYTHIPMQATPCSCGCCCTTARSRQRWSRAVLTCTPQGHRTAYVYYVIRVLAAHTYTVRTCGAAVGRLAVPSNRTRMPAGTRTAPWRTVRTAHLGTAQVVGPADCLLATSNLAKRVARGEVPDEVLRMLELARLHPQLFPWVWRAWQRLRRLAPLIGRWALWLGGVYNEVLYRPGNQGQVRAKESFELVSGLARLSASG